MEDILKVMEARHSVRTYLDKPIPKDIVEKLQKEIDQVNEESGLHFRLVTDEPKAFKGFIPKYGVFKNVKNYIVCAGVETPDFDERYGYYGERIVLYAQSLGLNSCWVGLTVKKRKVREFISDGEKLGCVIALGYGKSQGVAHKNKKVENITSVPSPWPQWFKDGMKGAMLAPTAINLQRFKVSLTPEGKVSIVSTGGAFADVDLGIVKYQFQAAAGKEFPGFAEEL